MEKLNRQGTIDVFYGDESHVCSEGYVPYGWQFQGEDVCILSERGHKINCWGLINRQSKCFWATTVQNIDSQFIVNQLENLSFQIIRETVIILDCARIHTSKLMKERIPYWQNRGLYIFFLPPYSPHLNLAEILWRKLKCEWLVPEDYLERENLSYAVNRCLANVGQELLIKFSPFSLI